MSMSLSSRFLLAQRVDYVFGRGHAGFHQFLADLVAGRFRGDLLDRGALRAVSRHQHVPYPQGIRTGVGQAVRIRQARKKFLNSLRFLDVGAVDARANVFHQPFQHVDRVQRQVRARARKAYLPFAGAVKECLRLVRDFVYNLQRQKSARPLHGVERAEDGVHLLGVVGIGLKIEEIPFRLLQMVERLGDKIAQESGIDRECFRGCGALSACRARLRRRGGARSTRPRAAGSVRDGAAFAYRLYSRGCLARGFARGRRVIALPQDYPLHYLTAFAGNSRGLRRD
jgi:hypothetical protein